METLRRRELLRGGVIAATSAVVGCIGDGAGYGEAWRDVSRIRLDASAEGWVGRAPEPIVDANNPALRLVHGRTYDVAWENQDGVAHRFEIRNGEGDSIGASPERATVGETASLEVEAVAGVVEYVCPHYEVTMRGDIEIFAE